MIGRSIRGRIALTYAVVFTAVLGALAVASYAFLAYTSQERVDEFLAESASTIAAAIEFERNLGATDTVAMRTVVNSVRLPDVAVQLIDRSSGHALSSWQGLRFRRTQSAALEEELADALVRATQAAPEEPTLVTLTAAERAVRVLTLPYDLGPRRIVIGVAQVMTARSRMLTDARLALGLGLPAVLIAMSLVAWWLAGRGLAPVDAIVRQATDIGATNLHARLPVVNARDELGRLSSAFNDLLARLEAAFEAQARFAADASHELRTPVAVISGESELALSRAGRSPEELSEALRVIRSESLRLRGIVDDLFFFARTDGGEMKVHPTPLHLDDLVDDSVRSLRSLATASRVTLQWRGVEGARIDGDEALLRRAIDNLVGNALKYTPTGGSVTVEVAEDGDRWRAEVRDTGPGIPLEAQERLFERFFRAGNARGIGSRDGAGLGLAIARWVARAHGGDAILAASSPAGSTFALVLPKSASDGRGEKPTAG